jgi:hypothetical protein
MAHLGGVTTDDSAEAELVATFQVLHSRHLLVHEVLKVYNDIVVDNASDLLNEHIQDLLYAVTLDQYEMLSS